MTGIGRARHQDDQIQATVEVRAVNNKFLKLNLRLPDALNGRESEIDRLVRNYLERGTISIHTQLTWVQQVSPYEINEDTLGQYIGQARNFANKFHLEPPDRLSDFLNLPGVVGDQTASLDDDGDAEWKVFEVALKEALENLHGFRQTEGHAMQLALQSHCEEISRSVKEIQERSPQVLDNYRTKLKDRVNEWLSEQGVQVETNDILR
ncbi:MAG: hypothetical protein KDA78_15845 [Planctomycetaceae bacterium]|nr:hypothetical protein [Planctomycetaceae bacterium]